MNHASPIVGSARRLRLALVGCLLGAFAHVVVAATPEVVMNPKTRNGGFETAGAKPDVAAGWTVDKGTARRVTGGGGANTSTSYLATELTYRTGSASGEGRTYYQYLDYPVDFALPGAVMKFEVSAWIKDAPQQRSFSSYAITVWVAYDTAEGKAISQKYVSTGWRLQHKKADGWMQVAAPLEITSLNTVSVDPSEWANGRNHRITKITLVNAQDRREEPADGTRLGRLWDEVTIAFSK